MKVRLVAVYNEDEEKYHIYITNIQKDVLNVKDIAKLYGARWDIETPIYGVEKQICS
jgi:putative transposase